MKSRVTQGDVARAVGVHNTTVSLALRNSRLIPAETRLRIQAVAQRLGYCPDPILRALVAYRNTRRPTRERGTLAYITNWETKWGWQELPPHAQYHAGARRKAAELGYQLEHLWMGEAGLRPRRLGNMLVHRGIHGVVLASHRPTGDDLSEVDWSRLSAVTIGSYPRNLAATRVTEDHGHRLRVVLQHVHAIGYRRAGFILASAWDEHAGLAWSTTFAGEQSLMDAADRVPLLRLPGSGDIAAIEQLSPIIADWYHHYRPDVVIGLGSDVAACLEASGLVIPNDVAYVDLGLEKPDGRLAGLQPNSECIGALAVELLSSQLLQNNLGLPAVPTVTAVGGSWHPGDSLPNAENLSHVHASAR